LFNAFDLFDWDKLRVSIMDEKNSGSQRITVF
jgi:hypothetical protein